MVEAMRKGVAKAEVKSVAMRRGRSRATDSLEGGAMAKMRMKSVVLYVVVNGCLEGSLGANLAV